MVGNSNTRWHWQTRDGAAEPAIPWDAWLFPDGTPVSHTEAAALRRYVTGRDEFLAFDAFLPREVADGDHVLSLPVGEEWHADIKGDVVGDALVEVSFWPEQPNGTFTLALRTKNRTELSSGSAGCTASQTVMQDTDIGGAANYTNFELGAAPLGACQRACCDSAACAAWVVRELAGHEADRSCTGPGRCCWLKAATSGAVRRPRCTSSFVSRYPQPVRPRSFDGYYVVVDGSQLTVSRRERGRQLQLSSFDLDTLENGVVARAWNMLRVLVRGSSIDVWFNPMYPETGFEGTAADARKLPRSVPPRIAARDPSAGGPLAGGGVAVAADRFGARVDYISVLPPLVSAAAPLEVVVV